MVNNDYGMQDTVVRVIGPWEAESEDERGAVPIARNLDVKGFAYCRRWGEVKKVDDRQLQRLRLELAAKPKQTSWTPSHPEGVSFK